MAENITTLGIEVKTSGVQQAASDLQKLANSAGSAEQSTGGMASAIDRVNAQMRAMGDKAKGAGQAFKSLDPAAQSLGKIAKESENASSSIGKLGSNSSFQKIATGSQDAASGIRKATVELDKFNREANSTEKNAGSMSAAFASLSKVAGGLFAGFSIAQFAGKLVSVQREFDVLNSALITITGSSAKAENELQWIKSFAAETPFSLTEVTQAFIKLKTLGLDASKPSLVSFGNTASAMGKSLNQMIEAVADASTGEFERLKEFGIKAKKNGDEISLTFQGVTTTVKNSAEEISKYLTDIGNNNFAGAMAERAKTLDGAISNLGDSWDELFRTINNNNTGGLIFDSVKLATGAISEMISLLNAMNSATSDGARETGAFASAQSGLAFALESVAAIAVRVKAGFVGIGKELGAMAAQAAALASLDVRAAINIGAMRREDAAAEQAQLQKTLKALENRNKYNNDLGALSEGLPTSKPKSSGIGGGSTGKKSGGGRSVAVKESEEAKAYEQAMKGFADITASAQKSTLDLTASQAKLYDLMASPQWANMPEAWKQTAFAQFESARAAEQAAEKFRDHAKAMDEGKRIAESMRTPEEELAAQIVKLNGLLDEGAISWDVYARAVFAAQDKLDGLPKKAEETGKELDEFTKQAAHNMQDAMADFFINPTKDGMDSLVESFGKTMQKMIVQAGSAQLMNILFGDMGKTGKIDGVIGGAIKSIGDAFKSATSSSGSSGGLIDTGDTLQRILGGIFGVFGGLKWADGGAFSSMGVKAFASGGAFGNGEILTRPTAFKFASGSAFRTGIAGEAGPEGALPLKRMSNGKLGVHMSGGGGMTINQTINAGAGTDKAEVRRAAASGARSVLGVANGARRYG